ncbi:CDC24 calponin [Cordyceps militaris]|uniref:CDC24 calponin n=1 Tax=Cordyceps militaris TaxID=73501 RepID=A0A2H4SS99_CORMI|nr:CDC24 calponin [Cordyceps militaris]
MHQIPPQVVPRRKENPPKRVWPAQSNGPFQGASLEPSLLRLLYHSAAAGVWRPPIAGPKSPAPLQHFHLILDLSPTLLDHARLASSAATPVRSPSPLLIDAELVDLISPSSLAAFAVFATSTPVVSTTASRTLTQHTHPAGCLRTRRYSSSTHVVPSAIFHKATDMAHAILMRTNTAPALQTTNGVGSLTKMNSAPRSSHLSSATTYNGSSASLSSLSSNATVVPQNGGPVIATSNIINQKADASRSLYQICVSLKQRLSQVPDFQPYLDQLDPADPVDSLWNLFRSGHPLLVIYNCLQGEPLKVEDPNASEAKKSKIAIFKFVQACLRELQLPPADTFVITDLMGNDTSGFVKVTQVVNYVLDIAEQNGHLLPPQFLPEPDSGLPPPGTMSYRDHIVKELVDTERKYVQDLENLHDLKKRLEQKGDVPGDIVHQIFLNINAILDFQRRFLIRVETTNSVHKDDQRWGAPFCFYESAFDIYQPFIANQRKAAQIANLVFDKIQLSEHPVATDFNTLDGFLLKPMQRLVKYPLLLKDLNKKTDDEEIKEDLQTGCEAAERVLHKANDAVHRDLLDEALDELIVRVDDWKSHRVEQFGCLLLHGIYGVITGKTEQEKDYEIYLFENILLCCKEASGSKTKEKKDKTRSQGPKLKNKNAKLQLKGRIFMTNVTDIVSLSKPGSHSVQIWWKGDPGVENFTIKFVHEEMMKTWAIGLETQRKRNAPRMSVSNETAHQDFAWTRDHNLENPYLHQDEDEDDEYGPTHFPAPPGAALPRISSSSSVRQRSMTGESTQSLASIARAPPPRFPLPFPPAPLSLQTGSNGAPSPGARGGDSYFSPVADSPVSSRASTTSGVFPGPPYQFPNKNGGSSGSSWDENARYTAPAMPRAPSRDGPPSSYNKPPRGPSLPVMASNSSSAQQQRSRSYSTPDAGIPGLPRQRQPSQGNIPAVPGIPQHLHDSQIARSQNGSPRNELPIRTNSNSPGAARQPLHKHSGSLGGTMSHFPAQPIYPRQNTPSSQGSAILRVDPAAGNSRNPSPALPSAPLGLSSGEYYSSDMPLPTQLKVRVNCDSGNYITLVVAFNISYQSLIDRIDAKLARFMNSSISKGILKLRYRDEDGDFVTIESDDDIQIAFMEWREGVRNMYSGGVGEIELFCVGDAS